MHQVHRVDKWLTCLHYQSEGNSKQTPTSACCDLLAGLQDIERTSSLTPASLLPHPLFLEHYKPADRQTDRHVVILAATRANQVILVMLHTSKSTEWQVYFICTPSSSYPPSFPPSPYSPSTHVCCRAVQGERWSTLFAGAGIERPCSVSRRSPVGEDTGRLCSTPGPPASGDLLWCSGIGLEGTAAPGQVYMRIPRVKVSIMAYSRSKPRDHVLINRNKTTCASAGNSK